MRFFKCVVLVAPAALVFWTSAALAATGCAGAPAASAIHQYCETFPSSSGPHSATPGSSSLANHLPPRLVRQLGAGSNRAAVAIAANGGVAQSSQAEAGTAGRQARRTTSTATVAARQRLLTLPAASIQRARLPVRTASTSAFSLYRTLFIALIVFALALVATTLLIARHHRASGN